MIKINNPYRHFIAEDHILFRYHNEPEMRYFGGNGTFNSNKFINEVIELEGILGCESLHAIAVGRPVAVHDVVYFFCAFSSRRVSLDT